MYESSNYLTWYCKSLKWDLVVVLICIFPVTNAVKHFSCPYWSFLYLWWSVCSNYLSISNWCVCPIITELERVFILDTSSLQDICTVNIFSQSVSCLFILIIMSFKEQKVLILMKSNLSFYPIFLLWFMNLRVLVKIAHYPNVTILL